MAHIIWTSGKGKDKLDPALHKKAFAFTQKLREDDTLPGLNVEEIRGSADKRVRTGRVDDNFRAVMFKIAGGEDATYVIHGIWPHDKANSIAEQVTLEMNPINGVPEIRRVSVSEAHHEKTTAAPVSATTPAPEVAPIPSAAAVDRQPAWIFDHDPDRLHAELGLDRTLARQAVAARDEAQLVAVAQDAAVEWQGLALLSLATGSSISDVRDEFHLFDGTEVSGSEDEQLIQGLQREAARSSFHWIDSDEELRRVIEAGDLGAWRIFLHPEQRRYVVGDYHGPFRLTGGAGTGKTVVAVHRALRLSKENPQARILLTTFTRNLADDLTAQLRRLDEQVQLADGDGAPGITVKGIDQIAWSVIQRAGTNAASAAADVIGPVSGPLLKGTDPRLWSEVAREADESLPEALSSPAFLEAEYSLVVLPQRIVERDAYLRARRAGRGVALDRAKRAAIWSLIERYRAGARAQGTTDFDEKAAIAARLLDGQDDASMFDHVLVDEAQDLTPSRLQLLRALAAPGDNDLFLCEDSHQRIYGHKVTLSSVGIQIVGRSRRLTLNYRTTEENLRWAMSVLAPSEYSDMEGAPERSGFRSARSGPPPQILARASMADELDHAADLVRTWLNTDGEGRAATPESIAILVRDRYRRETVVNGLAERGLQIRPVEHEQVRPGMPVAMTMHRAKGLEFTHVLLFGLKDWSLPVQPEEDAADALLRERSLLYVAATRARDVLAASWSGERPALIPG